MPAHCRGPDGAALTLRLKLPRKSSTKPACAASGSCARRTTLAKLALSGHEDTTMLRLIFWLAVIAAGIWLWRRFKQPRPAPQPADSQDAPPMVRCACCGLHLPKTQALQGAGLWYCSQQHLARGPQAR
jgi:uncharacterized protein